MTVCAGSSMLLPTLEKFVFIIHGLQLTRLYLGLAVIHPSGFSVDEGLLFPYCWSMKYGETRENRSFVVTVADGSFIERLNPLP